MAELNGQKTEEDGRRKTYLDLQRRRSTKEWMRGGCGVFRHSMAKMLTGITWQFTVVLLVLIEIIINLVLMLISFHVVKDSEDHFASRLLHFVGISILTIFVFEIFLKLYALGWEHFRNEKIEIFDAFIVIIAFSMEITLSVMNAGKTWKSLGFIIALRLWRVLRVVTNIIAFKEELYELIDDEIDAKEKAKKAEQPTGSPPTERDALQEAKE